MAKLSSGATKERSTATQARLRGVSAGSDLDARADRPAAAAACGIHGRRVTSAAFVAILREAPGLQRGTAPTGG